MADPLLVSQFYKPTAEEELDRFFNLSPDMMCVVGFDGRFKRISPAVTKVLGYAAVDLINVPYIDFVHPDDLARTAEEAQNLSIGESNSNHLFRNRYRHQDGSYRWLEWHSNVVAVDQLIFSIARDVTSHVNAEQKVKLYSTELERSNDELQQFAYVASHDLQEPLRAVAGCVQMLQERNIGKLDDRSVELVGHAVDGAKRLQQLITDLLAYSRVGSKGIDKLSIESRLVVETAVDNLQAAIAEASAVITTGTLPRVCGDSVQLTQLFQNLIGNAIKFRSPERPAEIAIDAERTEDGVLFSVRDRGIGIAPEYYERVFGIFQRLNPRRAYPGTGIGLAICKKIVDRHDGRIWIETNPGGGSIFRVLLPEGNCER